MRHEKRASLSPSTCLPAGEKKGTHKKRESPSLLPAAGKERVPYNILEAKKDEAKDEGCKRRSEERRCVL